jgi:hypothetical protein
MEREEDKNNDYKEYLKEMKKKHNNIWSRVSKDEKFNVIEKFYKTTFICDIDFKDFFKIKFDIFNEGVFFEYEMDQGDRIFQSYCHSPKL